MFAGLFFHGILSAFLLAVIIYDATRYIIPNGLSLLLLLLYPIMLFVTDVPVNWAWALGVGGLCLVGGFVIYALKLFGAGDAKLFAVCGVWVGQPAIMDLIFYTAIFGGLLSIALLLGRQMLTYVAPVKTATESLPKVLLTGSPVPYGLAIAAAMLVLIWSGDIPGLPFSGF